MKAILLIILMISLTHCATYSTQQVKQGVMGNVLWFEGNLMPGPGKQPEGKPVKRELYVYPVIHEKDLKRKGALYRIEQKPLEIITTTEKGEFKVDLPPGNYSIFTREDEGFFANLQDSEGHVNPVRVYEGQYTTLTIEINYKAFY